MFQARGVGVSGGRPLHAPEAVALRPAEAARPAGAGHSGRAVARRQRRRSHLGVGGSSPSLRTQPRRRALPSHSKGSMKLQILIRGQYFKAFSRFKVSKSRFSHKFKNVL